MEVVLTTGPETPGMVEVATLYVEDLKKAGVKASLKELPAGQLFADFAAYTRLPLAAAYQIPVPALSTYQIGMAGGAPSALGWKRPDVDALVSESRAQSDPAAAGRIGTEAQKKLWEDGNTVLPVFKPYVNAQMKGVTGIEDDLFEQFPLMKRWQRNRLAAARNRLRASGSCFEVLRYSLLRVSGNHYGSHYGSLLPELNARGCAPQPFGWQRRR